MHLQIGLVVSILNLQVYLLVGKIIQHPRKNHSILANYTAHNHQPEQIHLSLGEWPQEIVVTWITSSHVPHPRVEYDLGHTMKIAPAVTTQMVHDNGKIQFVHRAMMITNVGYVHVYHVGSDLAWSEIFWYRSFPDDHSKIRFAFFGDMGTVNARILPFLQEEVFKELVNVVIHAGDFANDLHNENGGRGSQFMKQIQPIAAYVPYMVCPGNHEVHNNFSHYKSLFSMPGSSDNLWYSYNVGLIHFISIDTELFFMPNAKSFLNRQYEWLSQDLEHANLPEHRTKRPWIIVYGHRPMYCSNKDKDVCSRQTTRLRNGDNGFESLFYNFGVDVALWAHEHSYERLWPVYQNKVHNGTYDAYYNPGAPIHIISGSAGNSESVDSFQTPPPSWSAYRFQGHGYSRFVVHNHTHMYIDYVTVGMAHSKVIDSVWIIKTKHGPYNS